MILEFTYNVRKGQGNSILDAIKRGFLPLKDAPYVNVFYSREIEPIKRPEDFGNVTIRIPNGLTPRIVAALGLFEITDLAQARALSERRYDLAFGDGTPEYRVEMYGEEINGLPRTPPLFIRVFTDLNSQLHYLEIIKQWRSLEESEGRETVKKRALEILSKDILRVDKLDALTRKVLAEGAPTKEEIEKVELEAMGFVTDNAARIIRFYNDLFHVILKQTGAEFLSLELKCRDFGSVIMGEETLSIIAATPEAPLQTVAMQLFGREIVSQDTKIQN